MQEQRGHRGIGWAGIDTSSLIRIGALILLLAGCGTGTPAPPPPPSTTTNQSIAAQWALSWVPANLPPTEACHMNVTLASTGDVATSDFHGLQGPQKGTGSLNASTLNIMVAGYSFTGTLDPTGKTATGTMTNQNTGEVTPGTATRT